MALLFYRWHRRSEMGRAARHARCGSHAAYGVWKRGRIYTPFTRCLSAENRDVSTITSPLLIVRLVPQSQQRLEMRRFGCGIYHAGLDVIESRGSQVAADFHFREAEPKIGV